MCFFQAWNYFLTWKQSLVLLFCYFEIKLIKDDFLSIDQVLQIGTCFFVFEQILRGYKIVYGFVQAELTSVITI